MQHFSEFIRLKTFSLSVSLILFALLFSGEIDEMLSIKAFERRFS